MKGKRGLCKAQKKLLGAVNCESPISALQTSSNESKSTPPAKTFGASDRESRYKARAHEWLSSLAGIILPVLGVCKLVGVSMLRITLQVLTRLTEVSDRLAQGAGMAWG